MFYLHAQAEWSGVKKLRACCRGKNTTKAEAGEMVLTSMGLE